VKPVRSDDIFGLIPGYTIYLDGKIVSFSGRELAVHVGKHGYKTVQFKRNGKRKLYLVHRLLALCFIPNPHGKPQINHIDGDKLNNSLENLEWVTDRENKTHAHRVGLMPKTTPALLRHRKKCGDQMIAARRRFNADQQADIVSRRTAGESCRSIARSYSCSHTIISNMCAGRSYARAVL
jgi:hypothetical protein